MTVEELANKRYGGEPGRGRGVVGGSRSCEASKCTGVNWHIITFTEEDIKVIESVDCDDFYKVFDIMRFKVAEFLWGLYCRIKKV